MFARRKKTEGGFEWHKYIRTTIRVRREARRQRVVDARRAAGQQVGAAGAALAAGSRAAGSAAREGARAGLGALGLGLQALWSLAVHGLRLAMRPVVSALRRPNIGGPVALAGAVALGAGIGRARSIGLDGESVATLAIGIVLMSALLPMLAPQMRWQLPRIAGLSWRTAATAVAVVALVGSVAWFAGGGGLGNLAGVGNFAFFGASKPLQGRAYATGADTLRVAGTYVKLVGIEAPEHDQRCEDARGRSWRCGAAAEAALSRLVDGRPVSCALSGGDDAGRKWALCSIGSRDVGAELVRRGHVFADGTIFARYASQEREARSAKAGLWRGSAERPAAYRAKLWEEARRRAPGGCPIKGHIAGASRVYVLPWSPDYPRVRVQTARGERWFCSEEEAVAAGFRAAQRG
jgi:endonuclease YncB( thermonuclease family)